MVSSETQPSSPEPSGIIGNEENTSEAKQGIEGDLVRIKETLDNAFYSLRDSVNEFLGIQKP